MHRNVVRVIRHVQFQFHLVYTKMEHLLAASNDNKNSILIISLWDSDVVGCFSVLQD